MMARLTTELINRIPDKKVCASQKVRLKQLIRVHSDRRQMQKFKCARVSQHQKKKKKQKAKSKNPAPPSLFSALICPEYKKIQILQCGEDHAILIYKRATYVWWQKESHKTSYCHYFYFYCQSTACTEMSSFNETAGAKIDNLIFTQFIIFFP